METYIQSIIQQQAEVVSEQEARVEIFKNFKQSPKCISSKYFYDKKGSELFEQITHLNEYYPSRTEKSILEENASSIFKHFKGNRIIELGSGDPSKISILLSACSSSRREFMTYTPVDLSQTALYNSSKELNKTFSEVNVDFQLADFMKGEVKISPDTSNLFLFLGSTIGNLNREEAQSLLNTYVQKMIKGDYFLLGLDMVKEESVLQKAYNDAQQITAKFNTNILNHVNSICRTNFSESDFKHLAFYNRDEERIEMHLKAKRPFKIDSPFWPESICFDEEEMIHTENSHKFSKNSIKQLLKDTGLSVEEMYQDNRKWFSVLLLRK